MTSNKKISYIYNGEIQDTSELCAFVETCPTLETVKKLADAGPYGTDVIRGHYIGNEHTRLKKYSCNNVTWVATCPTYKFLVELEN